ncbi:PREDICTED: pentatricopeptide repeat-containing protein At2g22410, mitochondrial-like [Camelina sativa]|uniref:Pentatricopeptide repeat-containing protein At2g22410, mitochondrial-like n=1 Tax=Camelina sativa TaxID=90675 RepID=A0ABM0WK41_CAMSA|nr:PREDICTED: pentatricopeptide repeat-containing protein At2g22410, mitochondrial-like [Camelina sativa]
MNISNVRKAKLLLLHRPLIPKLNRSLYSYSQRRTRSLPHHRDKPINWNSTHSFVLHNPLLSLLEKCKFLFHLKQIQAQMVLTSLILDPFASSRLIAFCALSESRYLDYCVKILRGVDNPNAFSWNVTIRGFSESESPKESFLLYKQMLRHGCCECRPDHFTYPVLFKVCADLGLNSLGHMILGHVLKLRLELVSHVHNASIHMFASCGDMGNAQKVFDESPVRDLVSWNCLINGYKKIGDAEKAIQVYKKMESQGVKPDDVTMIGLVSSCAMLGNLNLGKEFYEYIKEHGLRLTVPLANSLMDMFSKCGDVHEARRIFDNLEKRTIVSWTTIISGYARSGLLDVSRKLFDDMEEKDVVLWNAIIGGSVQAKRGQDALALFQEMQTSNTKPDEITMIHCLSACSQLGALDVGIWIHRYIEKRNLSLNVALGTSLVDMYAKCGNISEAINVFHGIQTRNSLTYTAIIGGLALHGDASTAISYFDEMIDAGLAPDEITFIGLLSACCHAGLIQAGRDYFSQMKSRFNLNPQPKHYSIMVDLLGRAGLLEEADKLMENMPMEADAAVWGALLFGCRVHGNVALGKKAAKKLLELDPTDSGIYVLLDGMYGEANMWEDAKRARRMMNERGVEKIPGCSSIEVNGVFVEFIVRDKSRPESEKIYDCLHCLGRHMGRSSLSVLYLDMTLLRS